MAGALLARRDQLWRLTDRRDITAMKI